MLTIIFCISVIYHLVAGGVVDCVVGSWDAAPYLQGAVGYGAY